MTKVPSTKKDSKNKKNKGRSSWMQRHLNDPYVKASKTDGYRSRAAFKLIEIQNKHRIINPGAVVIDLGAAPGGWSQVVSQWVGDNGLVIALDLLEMSPLAGVTLMQGDFASDTVKDQLIEILKEKAKGKVDWVLSDMAPDMTGIRSVDQARLYLLLEEAITFALSHLKPTGGIIFKAFMGDDFEAFYAHLKKSFKTTRVIKPDASRTESRELYLFAQTLR
ncbi:MAG: RlmE family RNA methyltransferase [Pseudomonadota bacterium]